MFEFFALWGAYVWMAASFFVMTETLFMYSKTHKLYHAANAVTWLCAGVWGMTFPSLNVPWIANLNIAMPWIAAVTNVYAHTAKSVELFKHKQDQ